MNIKISHLMLALIALVVSDCAIVSPPVGNAEIKVMNSGAFTAAYKALQPEFETANGFRLQTVWGPSMGTAPEAIPVRITNGERADVVIMARGALDQLVAKGKVLAGSEIDLAYSRIGVAVKIDVTVPDISTVAAFRQSLLNAKSVVYSDSASGVYVSTELFKRLGIVDEMAAKSRMVSVEPIGASLARGEAELGFQQLSELLPVAGIKVAGLIPEEVQKMTVFSAGILVNAENPTGAHQLIDFLSSSAALKAIRDSGLAPAIRNFSAKH